MIDENLGYTKNDYEYLRAFRKDEIKGTAYFEVQKTDKFVYPEDYLSVRSIKCWGEESIYFEEDAWHYLDPLFDNLVPDYDFYGKTCTIKPNLAS